jgi:hypothetical protein
MNVFSEFRVGRPSVFRAIVLATIRMMPRGDELTGFRRRGGL